MFQDPLLSPDMDDLVVIYNRVPKTGSTSFAGIAYDLCTRNKFHVLHVNVTRNNHILSVADQVRQKYLIHIFTFFTSIFSKFIGLFFIINYVIQYKLCSLCVLDVFS